MRDATRCGWMRWRITVARRVTGEPAVPHFARAAMTDPTPPAPEQPGPDGIRHDLVARVRREIEAGTYDTEERWLAAEEKLLRRIEGR